MKINRYWVVALVLLFVISCSKKQDPVIIDEPIVEDEKMGQLVVDDNFQWSAALKGTLNISFVNPNNVSIEREIINITDYTGNVVKRSIIINRTASFKIDLPQNAQYFIHFPVTDDIHLITDTGDISMALGHTISSSNKLKAESVESCTTCENPMINAGGEAPVIGVNWTLKHEDDVPGWKTTATDKKIEIWTTGFYNVQAQEGSQFFELNANQVADLYQELCIKPGSTITWSVWHRGRSGVDVADVKIGATVESAVTQETMSDGKSAWGYYSGSYTVPEGQITTFFVFSSVSSASSSQSVGNFLDNFEIECDFDGDGTEDDNDDDPDNSDVSFISYFPTSGKQVVAFEDLWPSKGDFDFNDLTMSNMVKISKDKNFNLLSAEFTISIDAIGANIHNGIGMMLYNESKTAFGENIIASVSGDVMLDDDNTNGLIISNDVFEAISEYYQNNGVGPTAIPDTLKFTVIFNNKAEDFIPELYIFRTEDRTYEIHRDDFPATSVMNNDLFNTINDNGHYKTSKGLPWGLEVILEGTYKSPKEKVDMLAAYPQFKLWVTSGGTQNTNWYEFPVNANVVDISQ